jgi:predicted secreted protein
MIVATVATAMIDEAKRMSASWPRAAIQSEELRSLLQHPQPDRGNAVWRKRAEKRLQSADCALERER